MRNTDHQYVQYKAATAGNTSGAFCISPIYVCSQEQDEDQEFIFDERQNDKTKESVCPAVSFVLSVTKEPFKRLRHGGIAPLQLP